MLPQTFIFKHMMSYERIDSKRFRESIMDKIYRKNDRNSLAELTKKHKRSRLYGKAW